MRCENCMPNASNGTRKAADSSHSFWRIFWVDVSSESTATTDFLETAKILGAPVETADQVRQIPSNMKHDWLLVLDNADDHKIDFGVYFASGARGAILMTSRRDDCSQLSTV